MLKNRDLLASRLGIKPAATKMRLFTYIFYKDVQRGCQR
jgi:hypothetical protein